jgi:nucleotide-binding universal stress UspA family protein
VTSRAWHARLVEDVLSAIDTTALGAVALSIALQLAALGFAPLAAILHVTPLETTKWIVVVALAAIPAVVGQGAKALFPRS